MYKFVFFVNGIVGELVALETRPRGQFPMKARHDAGVD